MPEINMDKGLFNDDSEHELTDEAKKFNEKFPKLGPNEVYSGTLNMAAVKFPSPAHARAFFTAVSMMAQKLADHLGLEMISSELGVGVAIKAGKPDDDPPSPPTKFNMN